MVNAGASIEAFLKLDASSFNTGIKTATTSVTKFKESMLDIGKEANTFNTGVNQLSKALDALIRKMSLLEDIDSKAVSNFKTMASALLDVATAAQRLSVDAMRGHRGIEALNTIMEVFNAGVSSAEIVVKNLSANISNLGRNSVKDIRNIRNSTDHVKEGLLELGRGVPAFNRITAESNKAKAEMERMDATLKKVTNDFLELGRGIPAFNRIQTAVNHVNTTLNSAINGINSYKNAFYGLSTTASQFGSTMSRVNTTLSYGSQRQMNMGTALNNTTNSMNLQTNSARNLSTTTSNLTSQFSTLNMQESKLASVEKEVASSSNQATSSLQRQASASKQATASTNAQTTATNRLKTALSSLKMVGTMVASMMVWNFAHNLITATRETVNAKSEMEGYFKMLHFNQSEIGNFNKALDNTVSQFQRINKYSLGETISSIGVEFNLTTKEMEKAMPVVSMITSEYLRAGRNANEASLAVKDILQGEFQRLSRETGVKGDQLKEAGWSGDKNDVMGLLDALEKVGKSRNWDVFVTKANSLNDAVLILQNRFSEWTANMVNVVQPSILAVFNTLMSVGGLFGNVFSGIWQWLNGDGIPNQIVKWTGLATAIGTVVGALIHYRTGANLVQVAQMGLRGSITATIFSLKAEEVATYGSRNAIMGKILSLKAEQVANLGVKNAIMTKLLGLNAELVAQKGLKGAIMASTFANQLAKASEEGANAEKLKTIYLEQQEQLSKMGSLRAIFAKIAGVNMETFAERGLIVALAQRISTTPLYVGSLKAEEIAELSTAEAAGILMASILPLVAVFAAVAIAVYALIKPLQDASAEMKAFNTLNKDGDNIIKEHKKTYDGLAKSYENTNAKLSELEKGSAKYLRTEDKLNALEKDKQTAYDNWQNSIKAVEMTRSRQAKFEERRDEIAIHNQTRLKDAYIKAGLSAKEASEMASQEMRDAERGAEQLRNAINMIKLEADKGAEKQENTINMLKNYGLDQETIKKYGNNLADANSKVMEGMEKLMTSEDMMDRVGGWFEIQQGRFEEWWTELNAFFEVRDWDGIRDKLIEGMKYVLTGFGAFNWIDGLKETIDKKGLWGTLMDWLWGEGDSDGVLDIVWQWANDMVLQPLADWLNWFLEDPIAHFNQIENDLSESIGKFLFGKNSKPIDQIVWDWIDNNIKNPLIHHIENLPQYILDWVGGMTFDFAKMMYEMLFGKDSLPDDLTYDKVKNEILPKLWDGITKAVSDFFGGSGDGTGGGFTKKIDVGALLKNLLGFTDSIDFSWATEYVNNNIIIPLQTAWNEFMSDPIAYIGESLGITGLINGLLGVADSIDIGWALEWVNTNIISPISQTLLMFLVDPVSFIGDIGFSITGLLDSLFGTDIFTNVWTWVNTYIIAPIGNALWEGIQQIPLVGDIMLLLGFLSDENIGASEKGRAIANWIGNGITYAIGQIPIIGDIARMLGLIPQQEPNAQGKGKGIGDSIKDGVMNGLSNLGNQVIQEFNDILNGIGQLGEQAYNTAKGWADQLWQGVNSVLQRASPGFFHDQFQLEFGQDIPNAITEAGSTAYTVAQQYGQSIKDGISETSFNTTGFDSAVGIYESDAQIVADSSQLMGVTTTTAFNDMSLAVNQTTSTMSGNVATTYTGMQQKQQSSLNTMKNQNLQAYNDMYLKSNQSLIQMRDSTSNVTHQMVNAWDHMKNQIVASANRLKNDSTSHFNQLSNTIGSFYRKIQNPSNWGAGAGTGGTPTRSARHPTQGRSVARMMTRTASHHGAGISPYTTGGTGKTMTLRALKNMICPSGDCGIFDGYDLSQKVNVDEFLALIGGEHGFGWNDWSGKHYNYIKSTSDQWGMKSPVIQLAGGIPTNADYKVGDFENGTPHISFDAFQSMAESIFSVIPYKFYYDSNWKGSWLGALQAGACNCSDGADALIAFASACGFSGYKQHTTTKSGIGHFYAVINGKAMDTTHFQNSGSWTPLGGAGIPTRTATPSAGAYPQGNKTVNINVEITGTVYGVDDLDSKIQESVQEGLRAEFNDPYTVAI